MLGNALYIDFFTDTPQQARKKAQRRVAARRALRRGVKASDNLAAAMLNLAMLADLDGNTKVARQHLDNAQYFHDTRKHGEG